MQRIGARLLQLVLVLIGIGALAFLLWEPRVEGRNAHATNFEIYFQDPFLAYVYLGSLPFFVALYRAFCLVESVKDHGMVSQASVEGLCAIRRCLLLFLGFVAGAMMFILALGDPQDRPAGVFMCLLVAIPSAVAAFAAAMLVRYTQHCLKRSRSR